MPVPRDRLKAEVHSLNHYPQPGDFWFSDTGKVPRQIYLRGERETERIYWACDVGGICRSGSQISDLMFTCTYVGHNEWNPFLPSKHHCEFCYIAHRLTPILDSKGIFLHQSGLQKEAHPNAWRPPVYLRQCFLLLGILFLFSNLRVCPLCPSCPGLLADTVPQNYCFKRFGLDNTAGNIKKLPSW